MSHLRQSVPQRHRRCASFRSAAGAAAPLDVPRELLAILNAAERLDHISPLKSVGLHPLKGNRRGQWAITVNGPWRICFRFRGGDAHEVEIVDYH